MITNLFVVFDPCTGFLSLNWLRTWIFILILPYKFWFIRNKTSVITNKIIKRLKDEIFIFIPYKGTTLILISIFVFIIINNIIGLIPYVFTSSSHLIFSLALALPLWLAFILYGWINKRQSIFAHLLPTGTPGVLIPFIVIIETIRNIIRPGSLSVRLMANIIAGHLLMSLLGNNTGRMILIISTIVVYTRLILFESAVALIQGYVFITLTTLYSREI